MGLVRERHERGDVARRGAIAVGVEQARHRRDASAMMGRACGHPVTKVLAIPPLPVTNQPPQRSANGLR